MTKEQSPKNSTKGTFNKNEFTPEEERELDSAVEEMVGAMQEGISE